MNEKQLKKLIRTNMKFVWHLSPFQDKIYICQEDFSHCKNLYEANDTYV